MRHPRIYAGVLGNQHPYRDRHPPASGEFKPEIILDRSPIGRSPKNAPLSVLNGRCPGFCQFKEAPR